MKFKNLTSNEIEYAKEIYLNKNLTWDERMNILTKHFGKSERTTRKWLVKLGLKEKTEIDSEQYEDAKKRELNKNKKVYFFTWAQNNTPPHTAFLNNMKAYAKFRGADIHIIAGRYKNPTSINTDEKYDFWHEEITPYLDANRHEVSKGLVVLSDVKIQPTAVNPLSGMAGMSGINSCIFGSPKVHFEVIPAMEGYTPKKMWTTGACTVKNYTDSKSGKKGEFHHTLGFLIVEIENDEIFHVRQVTANNNGEFCDLIYEVKNGEVSKIDGIEAIVLGDIHLGDLDDSVFETTKKILDRLNPKHTIIHDLFNGHSISHHDLKNPIKLYYKEVDGTNSLKREINEMLTWLENMRKYNLVIVRSNHDDFIDRWIINADWKKDIKNSMEYMEYTKVLLENKAPKGIIPYIIDSKFKDIKTLNRDESFVVKGWELGAHGDIGANGTRGSTTQFRKLNTKIIVGHTHTPNRKDGVLTVGTSTKLRLGYNIGPSSWLHSHVIIHKNGKAQHINISKNGTYTTIKD